MSSEEHAVEAEPLRPETVEALRRVSTATLTTQLFARGLRNTFVQGARLMSAAAERMVGEAFTLRYIPAREDLDVLSVFENRGHPQRLAIESAPPGSVLVIDSMRETRAASFGHILATRFHRRGGAGIVTDGVVRDSPDFTDMALPTFATGAAATTNLALLHAAEIQVPIGCGGVPVYPGDVIVGDREGVVCIPRHLADEVATAALGQERLEHFLLKRIEEGAPLYGTYPPDEDTRTEFLRWSGGLSAEVSGSSR